MAGFTPTNSTTFVTAGAVAANRIVKFHSVANQVVVATAATEKFAGITQFAATAADQELGVINDGRAKLRAAGNISYGDYVTATAAGDGVATAAAAAFYVGIARQSAVSGDLFEVQIQFGQIADGT